MSYQSLSWKGIYKVEQLNSEEFVMRAESSSKDVKVGTCNLNCRLQTRFLLTASIADMSVCCW